METLVAEGSVETDPARRKEIYQRLNEITVDDCSVINICTSSDTLAFARRQEVASISSERCWPIKPLSRPRSLFGRTLP